MSSQGNKLILTVSQPTHSAVPKGCSSIPKSNSPQLLTELSPSRPCLKLMFAHQNWELFCPDLKDPTHSMYLYWEKGKINIHNLSMKVFHPCPSRRQYFQWQELQSTHTSCRAPGTPLVHAGSSAGSTPACAHRNKATSTKAQKKKVQGGSAVLRHLSARWRQPLPASSPAELVPLPSVAAALHIPAVSRHPQLWCKRAWQIISYLHAGKNLSRTAVMNTSAHSSRKKKCK